MKRCYCSDGCMSSALYCIIGRSRDLEIPRYCSFSHDSKHSHDLLFTIIYSIIIQVRTPYKVN